MHKLSFQPEYEFSLIGISSHENDYRLSWMINSQLGFALRKDADLEVYNKKHRAYQYFSLYTYHDDDALLSYYLIANHGKMGDLMTDMKRIDYFLKINGEGYGENDMTQLVDKLKALDSVMMAFSIEPETLKQPDKMLF